MFGYSLLSKATLLLSLGLGLQVSARSLLERADVPDGHWVDTWASMPQLTESANLPAPPFNGSNAVFKNSTLRQTIHTSIAAPTFIRVRISNVFGVNALTVTAASVALPANGAAGVSAIQPGTSQVLTFSGSNSTIIPNGALVVSDPIAFPVQAQSMLSITLFLAQGQQGFQITSHPGSRTTSFFAMGNQLTAPNLSGPTQSVAHWFFLSAVEAWVPKTSRAFVIVGDSITDGRGSDDNRNNRWPDLVLAHMQQNAATADIAVINQAAGGNRVLADGLGPNALGRIDRDVLAHSGVRFAMIFEGVNDIGTADTSQATQTAVGDRLIAAFRQIAARVHAQGIPLFAATITPFSAPSPAQQAYSNPVREATRQRVNAFIRASGTFDAVVDFDAILRDPANPAQLNPAFNSGDFLHPNVAGYTAIGNAFPLDIFAQFKDGVQGFQ